MVAEAGFEPAGMTLLLRKPALPIYYSAINAHHGQPLAAHQLLRCRFVALALSVAMSENVGRGSGTRTHTIRGLSPLPAADWAMPPIKKSEADFNEF